MKKKIQHVVNPLRGTSFQRAMMMIGEARTFLVSRASEAIRAADYNQFQWGIRMKRLDIDLTGSGKPTLIGKKSERFGEVVNICATIERLLATLAWFSLHDRYSRLTIREYHPSTSDENEGNDIVLCNSDDEIIVRCEVCDVASTKAGSNKKEKKDIRNLGCEFSVPEDGVDRFIATAPEFAMGLCGPKRKWDRLPYKYKRLDAKDGSMCLLQILPAMLNANVESGLS